jgi:hypothetical protein
MSVEKTTVVAKVIKVGRLKQLGYFYFTAAIFFIAAASSILI